VLNVKQKQIIWVDIGTHFGQEYEAVFGSNLKFVVKIVRRTVGACLLGKGRAVGPRLLLDMIKSRSILRSQKDRFKFYFVEPNPRVMNHGVYQQADSIYCFALGGSEQCAIMPLYFANKDKQGQGSSIFSNKPNVNLHDWDLVATVNPTHFAQKLLERLSNQSADYKVVLRLNCEGTEDEVIYAFSKIFGSNLVLTLGSLKDVGPIKGDVARKKLDLFMEKENLKFADFSSSVPTWSTAFSSIVDVLQLVD
jgi:hypothetical protein